MKCTNCGKNEVTFIYQSNINGKVTEKHLCSECAEQMGYLRKLTAHSNAMMQSLWGEPFFGRSIFDDIFSPRPHLLSRLDSFGELFSDMPALAGETAQTEEKTQTQEDLVEPKEQNRFSRMRQLNALRLEMKKAVQREEFERAAQLRDAIRRLEDTKESA